jgi:4-hydroxyphenylacetate 3-monooxygenase
VGARSGNNYLSALRKLKAELWLDGARVADPTIHPALVRRARTIASLYDLQMEHPGAMTWRLDDGDRAGLSFLQPRSVEEVRRRGAMFRRWAEAHGGKLEWTPDCCNAALAAFAAASPLVAAVDPRFGENLENYYREARRRDWCLTQTRPANAIGESDSDSGLKLVEQTAAGIVVAGRQRIAPSAPFAEELLVLSPPLAFAINCNARGLKIVCRTGMDCVAEFDRVLIPAERVFLCGDRATADALLEESNVVVNQMHQRVVNAAVIAELRLGLAASLADDAACFPEVRERLAGMIIAAELIRSCLHAAEEGAYEDRWSQFIPVQAPLEAAMNLFARLYER